MDINPDLHQAHKDSIDSITNDLDSAILQIKIAKIPQKTKFFQEHVINTVKNSSIEKLVVKYSDTTQILNIISMSNNRAVKNFAKNALLIGCNYIGTKNLLYGCINDTINIQALLSKYFGYGNFSILTDMASKKPTRLNMINELTNLLKNSKSGDTLFFLFSGHGTYTFDYSGDETDRYDEMIVPLDFSTNSCISDDLLGSIVKNNLKNGVTLFMLFDSCHSGTIVDLKYNYMNTDDNNKTTVNPKGFETSGSVYVISGCRDNQTSADAYVNYLNKNIYSGAMTYAFLKTINDLGTKITLKTLLTNMRTILRSQYYTQIPQLSSGKLVDINTTYVPI
jgi:hypothetical protein